jgi:hypothetical protein
MQYSYSRLRYKECNVNRFSWTCIILMLFKEVLSRTTRVVSNIIKATYAFRLVNAINGEREPKRVAR